jgi:hypothetical protein
VIESKESSANHEHEVRNDRLSDPMKTDDWASAIAIAKQM